MKFFHPKKICRIIKEEVIYLYRYHLNYYFISDKTYLERKYYKIFGRKLNLEDPQAYTEKLQWLKLYDRNQLYPRLADKYEVKKYVSETIGEEYIIPTIGIFDKFDDISFDSLPNQFVIKCTHDSASVVVCRDKESIDWNHIRTKITKALKINYYKSENRQWAYKNIKPRIIIEKYIEDKDYPDLRDYKFFCFNGQCKALFIASGRNVNDVRFDFFDRELNLLPFTNGHEHADNVHKPNNYEKMLTLVEKLSQNIPHVRVDLYEVNNQIYFGEMTFYHWGGMVPFVPDSWDYTFGSWLKLPK